MTKAGLGLSISKPRSRAEWAEVLSDAELNELDRIADNPFLLQALEKIICYELVSEGLLAAGKSFDAGKNFVLGYVQELGGVLSNERLGEDVRALFWGVLRLREGLQNIRNFKEKPKVGNSENPAI